MKQKRQNSKILKNLNSVSVRLAFRFSILVTFCVVLLSLSLVAMLNEIVRNQKSEELYKAAEIIEKSISENRDNADETVKLPYYISYVVYETSDGRSFGNASETSPESSSEAKNVLSTNDPYLPILPETGKKAKKYVQKDFFIDGDLNIYYYTKKISSALVIETSLNMETDSFTKMSEQLPKGILILFFPILIISFFVSLFITNRTIQPVKKITSTAKELGSSKLDALLPVSRHDDEIDDLSKTFNDLFRRLKFDFERERQFTSDVSHELKTPVSVISGQANLLRRWGKDNPAQLEKSLDTIIKESKSMSAIIENLLQISRLENGRIKPQLERFKILDLFRRLKDEAEILEPSLIFEIKCDEKIYVIADKELLHQVFTIIVSNSLKYCGAANVNPIKIVCECKTNEGGLNKNELNEGEGVFISIRDNGNGFDEKTKIHAFERFYRGDESHSRSAGGSGLGLAIAKTIVKAMDGTIKAENNGGAEIIIFLKD